jgi:nucleotide-binding universal stress UspA family protein
MDGIVCATRGGEGSRAVQSAAIEHAQTTGQRLIFLYVIDADTIHHADEALQAAVRAELNWMGNTLLRMAHKRARAAGLDAGIAIREGNVREAIALFVQTLQAGLLFLGAPRANTVDIFGDDEVERFALAIQESTGIAVEIIRPEGNRLHLTRVDETG